MSVGTPEKRRLCTHMLDHPPSTLGDLLSERRASLLISRDENLVLGGSSFEPLYPRLPFKIAALWRIEQSLDLLPHLDESGLVVLDWRVGVALEVLEVPTTA